jgi:hypothetical protein
VPAGVSLPDSNDATVSVGVQGASQVLVAGDFLYAFDSNANGATDQSVPFNFLPNPAGGTPSQMAVAWAPDGRLVGLRCHPTASGCQIQVIRDADANYTLDAGADELLLGPSYTGTQLKIWGPGLAFDASGNIVAAYTQISDTGTATPTVLHDRDGSGAFSAGAPETVAIETLPSSPGNLGSLAVDHSGRVAYGYAVVPAGFTLGLRIAYDRNGDGDYADGGPPETFTPFATGGGHAGRPCGGVAFDQAGRLAALFAESTGSSVRLFRDLNGDGDFTDPTDLQSIAGSPTSTCAIAGHLTGGIAAAFPALHVDRNDDGDFGDASEATGVSVISGRVGVTFTSAGRAWLGGARGSFAIDPN